MLGGRLLEEGIGNLRGDVSVFLVGNRLKGEPARATEMAADIGFLILVQDGDAQDFNILYYLQQPGHKATNFDFTDLKLHVRLNPKLIRSIDGRLRRAYFLLRCHWVRRRGIVRG